MNSAHNSFEPWWKEIGQFQCASGQHCHKQVIYDAFVAGFECSKLTIKAKNNTLRLVLKCCTQDTLEEIRGYEIKRALDL